MTESGDSGGEVAGEVVLAGGGRSQVRRSGNTVRRTASAWTPAVHALLRHLEAVGFEGAPRVLGTDDDGREVLSYVAGQDGHHARRPTLHEDAALVEVARLIRRFHDAATGFVPPADAQWQTLVGAPTAAADDGTPGLRGVVVCHNDLAPVNTIYRDDRPVAFVDWDYAAPAPRGWDLACAAWSFVPLAPDAFCHRYGYSLAPRGPRLRLFCDAYGMDGDDRAGLLELVRARQVASLETVRRTSAHPANAAVGDAVRRWLEDIDHLDEHREDWQRHLD